MNKTRSLILVALFAALTAIGAFIKIPIPYVPFTLQFSFCAFAGIFLGSKLGALSQMIYVFIGLMGIPVFTQGGGPTYILKPTFGYLIGFIVGAYVIGKIAEKIKEFTVIKTTLIIIAGLFFVYLLGIIHLYFIQNLYLGINFSIWSTVYYGMIICLGGDIFLSFISAIIVVRIIPILKKSGVLNNNIK